MDDNPVTRRESLKLAAGAGVFGTLAGVAYLGRSNGWFGRIELVDRNDRSLTWDGDGNEHASVSCGSDELGVWTWVLTRGGVVALDEAILRVDFEDGTTVTVEGYHPGNGRGTIHFDVVKQGGGTVTSAATTFSGGGVEPLLVLTGAHCRTDDVQQPATTTSDTPTPTPETPTPTPPSESPTPTPTETPTPADTPTPTPTPEPTPTPSPTPTPTETSTPTPTPEQEDVLEYWQLDFGEGANPPIPPRYWPDDGMWAVGSAEEGVEANPTSRRQRQDGQLGDVDIDGNQFSFDDESEPTEVSVSFSVDEDGPGRYLHLALFEMPGPFDPDEIDEQVLINMVSKHVDPGESDSLTLTI